MECDEIFNDYFIANSLHNISVKFLKTVTVFDAVMTKT